MDMTAAKRYWRQVFLDYDLTKPINLPFDRKLSSTSIRTGQGLGIGIYFRSHIVEQLLSYVSNSDTTLYRICLTIYYIFLLILTGGQLDLIVGTVHANRYRPELQRLIGIFVNTLPIRIQINPQDTFKQILSKVSNVLIEAHMHSHCPYQSIIEEIPMKQFHERNFIQTMFTLDELSVKSITLDETSVINPWSVSDFDHHAATFGTLTNTMSMFDMTLSLEYTVETQSLRAQLVGSSDLFDPTTIINIARQFQFIVEQLFSSESMLVSTTIEQPISKLSLVLLDEIKEEMYYKQFHTISKTNFIGTTLTFDL